MTNASLHKMVSSSGLSEAQTAEVLRVLEEYLAKLEAGGQPHPEELLARHPEQADLLREYLDRLDMLHEAAVRFRLASPIVGEQGNNATPLSPVLGGEGSGVRGTPDDDLGRLGDFQLRREVGRGGMGIVYEAEQVSLKRRVALKVLPFAATMDARRLKRFQNEARAAAGLHHTNIVPVHFVGSERGVHYYAMQFIDGRDLASIVKSLRARIGRASQESPTATTMKARKPSDQRRRATPPVADAPGSPGRAPDSPTQTIAALSTERSRLSQKHYFRSIAKLGIQAAEALDYAHQQGIIHRDIKPANLLLDGEVRLWITDFGLACIQGDSALTMTGDLLGTLRYMSPEQALAKRVVVDHRTDIYSLGATLYELLTLEPVFTGSCREELLRQITFEEPSALRRINKTIPAELETIVLMALEKNPADRYATAQDMAEDLERFVKDEPIKARRPSLVRRLKSWSRRHKPLVAGVAAIVVTSLVLCGLVVLSQERKFAATARAAEDDLKEAENWQKREQWPDALHALERARGRLEGSGLTSLQAQVNEHLREINLVARLEDARLQFISNAVTDYDFAGADRVYRTALKHYGLDVLGYVAQESARRIRSLTIRHYLVDALDYWAVVKDGLANAEGEALRGIARLADDDPWRQRLRDLHGNKDRLKLEHMADEDAVLGHSATSLLLLSKYLEMAGAQAAAEGLLRRTQARYPADFSINYTLANGLLVEPVTEANAAEATGYLRAALAIRPKSAAIYNQLAAALYYHGKLPEAIAAIHKAIELNPNFPMAYHNLATCLCKEHKWPEALKAFRVAIKLNPSFPGSYANLVCQLRMNGMWHQAMIEQRKAREALRDSRQNRGTIGFYYQVFAFESLGPLEGLRSRLEVILQSRPKGFAIWYGYAELCAYLGKEGSYRSHCSTLLEQFGNTSAPPNAARTARACLLLPASGPDFERACALADRAITLGATHPLYPYFMAVKGLAEYRQSHFDAAIKCLSMRKRPYHGFVLAMALHRAEQRQQAREILTAAIKEESLTVPERWMDAVLLREAEALILPDVSAFYLGKSQPRTNKTRLELLGYSLSSRRYVAVVHLFNDVIAEEPQIASDIRSAKRYNAASAAALGGCGQGIDTAELDDKECAQLRLQAYAWLSADVKAWGSVLQKEPEKNHAEVLKFTQLCQQDKDFKGVRDPDALAALPEAERQQWQNLWRDIDTLKQRATRSEEQGQAGMPNVLDKASIK